jgi:hypothetical protein
MPSEAGRWLLSGLAVLAAGAATSAAQGAAAEGAAAVRGSLGATNCPHPSVPVPAHEPKYTSGPTELVSGLYIQGGAVPPPPCHPEPRGPYAGKLTITNRNGTFRATQTVGNGHLAHIPLAPGHYRLNGRLAGGGSTVPVDFTVRAGQKVRQDAFEDVP